MRISIFTTITDPWDYQYAWLEALSNYTAFADEVVVVNGGLPLETQKDALDGQLGANKAKIKEVMMSWPKEWEWKELPEHLNAGLEACAGDWAIKMDIDYFLHEKDFAKVIMKLREYLTIKAPAVGFIKLVLMNRFRGFEKAILPLAINKGVDLFEYGKPADKETDWCWPIYKDSKKALSERVVFPLGGVNIWDYDYFFRTKGIARKEFARFARAHKTSGLKDNWGETEEESWKIFLRQGKGRINKCLKKFSVDDHPKILQKRLRTMVEDEFGFNNWDYLKNI